MDERYQSQATQQSSSSEQQQQELQRHIAQLERSLGTALAAQQGAEADAAARGKQAVEERRLREGAEQRSAGAAAAAARHVDELQAAMCAALRGHQEQLAEAGMRKAAELEALQARFLALLATRTLRLRRCGCRLLRQRRRWGTCCEVAAQRRMSLLPFRERLMGTSMNGCG